MFIGYARDSPHDQTLTIQRDALKKAGCNNIFTDIAGGGKTKLTGLDKALSSFQPGDTFVVWKLDHLGTSLKGLIQTVTLLEERGVGFISLTDKIDTTGQGGNQFFRIFGALRSIMRAKTRAGLSTARTRGRKGGRPKALTPEEVTLLRELYNNPDVSVPEICRQLKISRMTLYRYVRRQEKQQTRFQGLVRQLKRLGER